MARHLSTIDTLRPNYVTKSIPAPAMEILLTVS